jgi:hypothetical protein
VSDKEERLDPYGIADATAEVAANTLLCLIKAASVNNIVIFEP